ncbi:MAG: four helix bundle protein [Acidobacteriia bacterium]|nr:four helix bundle protein [Terriglobia bacterium]
MPRFSAGATLVRVEGPAFACSSQLETTHARASLLEAETQLEIAFNLGYMDKPKLSTMLKQSSEVGRMLTGLRDWAEDANS